MKSPVNPGFGPKRTSCDRASTAPKRGWLKALLLALGLLLFAFGLYLLGVAYTATCSARDNYRSPGESVTVILCGTRGIQFLYHSTPAIIWATATEPEPEQNR